MARIGTVLKAREGADQYPPPGIVLGMKRGPFDIGAQVGSLPSLKRSLDLIHESRPLLLVGMIHIVIGKVIAANGVAGH
jgi:hypothetical protein